MQEIGKVTNQFATATSKQQLEQPQRVESLERQVTKLQERSEADLQESLKKLK